MSESITRLATEYEHDWSVERMLRWFDPDHDNREPAVGQAMREIAAARGGDDAGLPEWPLPNVWLGISVEDQATADEHIPP